MTDFVDADMDRIISRVREEIPGVLAIYLFGSMAKGTQDENSDYDIAVIVKELPADDIEIISKIRYSLLSQLARPLDIIAFALKDLEYPSPILYEIFHSRKLIYGPDIMIRSENIVAGMKPIVIDGATVGYHV